MKKLFSIIPIFLTLLVVGCTKPYDDSEIRADIADLQERVEKLEEMCREMNTNISALQTIVEALQNNDYITGVTPITENGVIIGYTITFAKSAPITIYHGEDGKDGADGKDDYTPQISVRMDEDGIYYWTLDGEWMLDSNGNKIKAQGTDGKDGADGSDGAAGSNGADGADGKDGQDGITPQLKIENDYWYVSYDNGKSWVQLGKATGEKGDQGDKGDKGDKGDTGLVGEDGKDGDAFFQSVSQDEQFVHFTLADGTVITLPKGASLDITFDVSDLVVMHPNTTREIAYTVQSVTTNVVVEVTSSADIKAKVISSDASGKSGVIKITTSAVVDEYSKVIVFVGNGEKVVMKSIAFEQSGLEISNDATQNIAAAGGNIALNFLSNMEWQVAIPTEAQSWISFAPSTRAMTAYSVSLAVLPNTSLYERSADVKVVTLDGKLSVTYTISQGIFNSFTATASSAWQEGDKMSIFAGNNKNQQFNYNGANGLFEAATTYSGTPAATSVHYAVYPYSSTYSLESDGKILVNLPSEQSYVANGFKREYNAMVAVSSGLDDTNFVMRPICAYICVKLWGNDQTVKSLTLSTTAGEKIAGKALVTPSISAAPTCVMSGSATSIKLTCSKEVDTATTADAATEFWFVVPAVTLSQGYTIKVVGFYGGEQTITVADPITLESGATYTTTHELTISTNGSGMGVGGWGDGENVEGEI